jgi:L-serine/L-threonine ammonia-lyase
LNIPTTVVVPTKTSLKMRNLIEGEGAELILHGDIWDEANNLALKIFEKEKDTSVFIPPFDHELIFDGHASIIHEIKEDLGNKKPDLIITGIIFIYNLVVGGGINFH